MFTTVPSTTVGLSRRGQRFDYRDNRRRAAARLLFMRPAARRSAGVNRLSGYINAWKLHKPSLV